MEAKALEAYLQRKATLQQELQGLQTQMLELKAKLAQTAYHLPLNEVAEADRYDRLREGSKDLVETVILAGVGGLLGVALGIAVPYVVTHFAHMRTIVVFWSPLLAFGISALVGVVFGIHPALRAAGMAPVEALRHE